MSYICCNQKKPLSTSIELNEDVMETLTPNIQSNFSGKKVTITTKLRTYLSRFRDYTCNNKAKCLTGFALLATAVSVTTCAILKQTQGTKDTEEPIVASNVTEALTTVASNVTEALTTVAPNVTEALTTVAPNVTEVLTTVASNVTETLTTVASNVTEALTTATTAAYKVKYLSCFDSLINKDALVCKTKQNTFDEYAKELNASNLNPFITNVYEYCYNVFTDKKCEFVYDPDLNNRVIITHKESHIEASGNNIEYTSCVIGDNYNTLFCTLKQMLDYSWIHKIMLAGLDESRWNIEFCYSVACDLYDIDNKIFSSINTIKYISKEDPRYTKYFYTNETGFIE